MANAGLSASDWTDIVPSSSSLVSTVAMSDDSDSCISSVNLRATHAIALNDLRQWRVFEDASDAKLRQVRAVYSFNVPSYLGCQGGAGIIFLTTNNDAFGYGHNCSHINILGYPRTQTSFGVELITKPLKIPGLSQKGIQQMSVGGLIGAAISDCGMLIWWGHCSDRDGQIMSPHRPRSARRRYLAVTCGFRLMAALDLQRNVFVFGQLIHKGARYFNGEKLIIDFPVSHISCGAHHLAMMDVDGLVYTWGLGAHGQRGLSDYTSKYDYEVTVISNDPCIDVKCGPFSTFCLTAFHELKACGSNGSHYLGHLSRSRNGRAVTTLTKICLFGPVADIVVLWNADYTATMVAQVADIEVVDHYIWGAGSTPYPTYSGKDSLFGVFTSLNVTPGLEQLRILGLAEELGRARRVHEHRCRLTSDAIFYIYLRDREELSREASRFLRNCKNRRLIYTVNLMPWEDTGGDFILRKFMNDLRSQPQVLPETENINHDHNYSSDEDDEDEVRSDFNLLMQREIIM